MHPSKEDAPPTPQVARVSQVPQIGVKLGGIDLRVIPPQLNAKVRCLGKPEPDLAFSVT